MRKARIKVLTKCFHSGKHQSNEVFSFDSSLFHRIWLRKSRLKKRTHFKDFLRRRKNHNEQSLCRGFLLLSFHVSRCFLVVYSSIEVLWWTTNSICFFHVLRHLGLKQRLLFNRSFSSRKHVAEFFIAFNSTLIIQRSLYLLSYFASARGNFFH